MCVKHIFWFWLIPSLNCLSISWIIKHIFFFNYAIFNLLMKLNVKTEISNCFLSKHLLLLLFIPKRHKKWIKYCTVIDGNGFHVELIQQTPHEYYFFTLLLQLSSPIKMLSENISTFLHKDRQTDWEMTDYSGNGFSKMVPWAACRFFTSNLLIHRENSLSNHSNIRQNFFYIFLFWFKLHICEWFMLFVAKIHKN